MGNDYNFFGKTHQEIYSKTMKTITIAPSCAPTPTELYIGKNILESRLIKHLCGGLLPAVICTFSTKNLGNKIAKMLNAPLFLIPNGEKGKTYTVKLKLEKALFHRGFGKDTVLIAVGGGAATDLVGFVAACYMRGVALILIPTTLLGMVDAAIGGKTGIDLPFGKNLIGSLYPPRAIVSDLNVLETLPEKEWNNGYAEILKLGLVFDASLLELPLNAFLIEKAIQGKIAIITQDPTEKGIRHILNFGHTIGHALEAISHYKMSHGYAVALGSLVEAHLSYSLGLLKQEEFKKIPPLYQSFLLKLPKGYTRKKLVHAMLHDKKNKEGKIRIVLMEKLGKAAFCHGEYCQAVSLKELIPTLSWMEKTYG